MDFLIELVFTLLFEESVAAATSRQTPKPLRILLGVLLSLFIVGVLGGIVFLGVFLIVKRQETYWLPLGVLVLFVDGIMMISAGLALHKQLTERKEQKEKRNDDR